MKILIAGDTHGEPGALAAKEAARMYDCEAIVQLGDFWAYDVDFEMPCYFIPGNHEIPLRIDLKRDLVHSKDPDYPMHRSITMIRDYEPFELGGLSWGGIGKIQDSEAHRQMLLNGWWLGEFPWAWMNIDGSRVGALRDCDILVFHDMPHFERADEDFLCTLIRDMEPSLVLHGHMHKFIIHERAPVPVYGIPPMDPAFDNARPYVLDTEERTLTDHQGFSTTF